MNDPQPQNNNTGKILIFLGVSLILVPWLWAFTLGRASVGEAQGSGTAAFYASVVTIPLGLVMIAWGILRPHKK